ncbi:MAG: glycosyltransferase [Anaerolineae bacterium]|nr:glycosyltransferase [Anaerolineae bacterium]
MAVSRVLHLSKMTGAAGSEGHLLVLLHGQRAQGIDARLWILVEPDNPVQEVVDRATALGIPVERITIHRHFDPGLWGRLINRFRTTKPDMLHTHLLHADLYGIPAARRANVPYVVSSRHNDDKFRRQLPMRWLHRWLWSQTDAGIAISEAIRQFSIRVEGVPASKIHTIHYGLDPATVTAAVPDPAAARAKLRAELQLPSNAILVGSICRLIEQKGLIYGLRAFARIAEQVPDAGYVIAGDGNLREALQAEAHTLGIADRVHFLGWCSDAYPIFAALDVFLAPSLWEGFGLVFLEAMALSVPVISTTISAIPEVVKDGITGWLVPPRNADTLAGALREALTDTAERHKRGAAGRRRLENHFTVETMVKCTLTLYRELSETKC